MSYYNRYSEFVVNGDFIMVPHISLVRKSGGQEWNIPDSTIITVPFPLMQSLEEYKSNLDQYFLYYGR